MLKRKHLNAGGLYKMIKSSFKKGKGFAYREVRQEVVDKSCFP